MKKIFAASIALLATSQLQTIDLKESAQQTVGHSSFWAPLLGAAIVHVKTNGFTLPKFNQGNVEKFVVIPACVRASCECAQSENPWFKYVGTVATTGFAGWRAYTNYKPKSQPKKQQEQTFNNDQIRH
ncbi:MAG: hypothetical protein CL947_01000 [Epsilonproteobacteria bacterium]|nr:hypothetical protein [Campylobacterota bacterium]|tara:strand:- start:170 stop:553 length:384 start_codon:yes stop_codon:yes gene_type:complete